MRLALASSIIGPGGVGWSDKRCNGLCLRERIVKIGPFGAAGVALLALGSGKNDFARELYAKAVTVPEADLGKVRETIGLAAMVADQHRFAAEIFEQAIAAKPPKDKLAAYNFYLSGALEFAGGTVGTTEFGKFKVCLKTYGCYSGRAIF